MAHNPLPSQLADRAELIVNTFQESTYQHHQVIDAENGIYDCDCSEFVGFILQTLAPAHYAMIPFEEGHVRPRAFEYYEFLAAQPLHSNADWTRIDRIADARRGDIVSWRFAEIVVGQDTGHIVYLAETPTPNNDGTFNVRVYDSANGPHFKDTRADGESGVGSGFISFQVNSQGQPTAYLFGPGFHFDPHPIVIGRTEPPSTY